MSANLEKAIQKEVHELTDEQQELVMAFVQSLKPAPESQCKQFSFIGISHSGNGSLSTEADSILDKDADRREGWGLR